MAMNFDLDTDWQEALKYREGQKVELVAKPGTIDLIVAYDAMMVPPIWLANDPRPRYPHELRIVSNSIKTPSFIKSKTQRKESRFQYC